jgi:protocatechuate 3,4-dioxygenase, beta subunit
MAEPPAYSRHRAGTQPPYLYPDYASTVKRSPTRPLIRFEHTLSEITGPSFSTGWAGPAATDLTKQHKSEPLGERIIVTGRILDEDARPIPNTLVELWAVQRRRPLSSPGRPARCAARPQLYRRRPGGHR